MKLTLMIFLTLSSIIQYSPQVIAQTKKPAVTKKQPAQPSQTPAPRKPTQRKKPSRPVFVSPKTPNGLSRVSGRRTGMGSRNNCPAVSIPLTALAPLTRQQKVNQKPDIGVVGGLTTSERPTFWFYVPYTQDNRNLRAEFSLQDSTGEDIYRNKAIALPAKPGVIGVSLPDTVKSLEVNQSYRWYFKIRCNQQTASLPVYVEGEIQRINLDSGVTEELFAANPQQKIAIYAKEGIWFDALNMLAQLRQSSQDASVKKDWQSLLQSANLDNISTAPLVN